MLTVSVEIPGVTDANQILEDLGKPGSLDLHTADETASKLLDGSDIAAG